VPTATRAAVRAHCKSTIDQSQSSNANCCTAAGLREGEGYGTAHLRTQPCDPTANQPKPDPNQPQTVREPIANQQTGDQLRTGRSRATARSAENVAASHPATKRDRKPNDRHPPSREPVTNKHHGSESTPDQANNDPAVTQPQSITEICRGRRGPTANQQRTSREPAANREQQTGRESGCKLVRSRAQRKRKTAANRLQRCKPALQGSAEHARASREPIANRSRIVVSTRLAEV
jgi:hypothetical protein